MKLSILIGLAAMATGALSASGNQEGTSPINHLDVEVSFPESSLNQDGNVILVNEQETPLTFFVTNREASPLIVAGYGGAVYDQKQPDVPYANLSTTSISPVEIKPGETVDITHAVRIALPPKDFDIEFTLYLSLNDEIVRVSLSKRLISVEDSPISSLDPRLLFVQILFGITAIVGGYFASTKFVLPIIEENLPSNKKAAAGHKEDKKKKTPIASSPSDGRKYDESWIPEHHLRKKKT